MNFSTRLLILLFPALLLACKKERVNIRFGDQPLSVVKSYINGQWKFIYAYGGFTGHNRYDYVDTYLEFYGDSAVMRSHDTISIAAKIDWKTISIGGRQAYYMQYRGGGGYIVEEIKNGELILSDYADDGMTHYLHRVR